MDLRHSIDATVRVPRGDSGHIRGDASVVLVALSELQDAVRACASEVKAPAGIEPTITITLGATEVGITASWRGAEDE